MLKKYTQRRSFKLRCLHDRLHKNATAANNVQERGQTCWSVFVAAGTRNLRGVMNTPDNLPSDVVLRAQVCCKRTTFVRWLLGKDVGATWQPRMQR